MVHDIGVWLFDQPVGTLSLVGGRLSFQYRADWLAKPNALALSQSLPFGPEPFVDHQCRAFFAGLLPEGNLRRLIAQQCQVSSQNDFALLNAIGGDQRMHRIRLRPGDHGHDNCCPRKVFLAGGAR